MMNTKLSPPRGPLACPSRECRRCWSWKSPARCRHGCTRRITPRCGERFLETADRMGCHTESWALPHAVPPGVTWPSTWPVGVRPTARTGSSSPAGLHGTEAPLAPRSSSPSSTGSATSANTQDVGVLFLHALNPYGYAWRRRNNEENIDLNRNFLLPGEEYKGRTRCTSLSIASSSRNECPVRTRASAQGVVADHAAQPGGAANEPAHRPV